MLCTSCRPSQSEGEIKGNVLASSHLQGKLQSVFCQWRISATILGRFVVQHALLEGFVQTLSPFVLWFPWPRAGPWAGRCMLFLFGTHAQP